MINLSEALNEAGLVKIVQMLGIFGVRVIPLARFLDSRGNLSFVDFKDLSGSNIKRMFSISSIPLGVIRGDHAHRSSTQLLHSVVPNIILELDNLNNSVVVNMDTPDVILIVPPKIWVRFTAGSTKSILNVLATEFYDESDYIHSYEQFIEEMKKIND